MALIKEYKSGDTTVRIHDDYMLSEEESLKVWDNLTDKLFNILVNQERAKIAREKAKEDEKE